MNYQKTFIIFILLVTGSSIQTAQIQLKTPMSNLPQEVIQDFMLQLAGTIGSAQIVNKEDLKVIIKNVIRLSQVNKNFYRILSSPDTTNMLLEALSQRFKIAPLDIAAQLKTQGTKLWLKSYIHTSGDYEQYLALQKIYAIADQVTQEARNYGVSLTIGKQNWPTPNAFYHQTKQGFVLAAESYPSSLYTPWGEVKLFGGGSGNYKGFMQVFKEFLKHFDWKLFTVQGLNSREAEFSELNSDGSMTPISKDAVRSKEGSKTIILANLCGYASLYHLLSVDSSQLPKFIDLERNQYRSYEAVNAIWKAMEDEYKQTNIDTSSEENQKERSYIYEEKKKNLSSPYEVVPAATITTIDQIPALCIARIKKLSEQPIFTGRGMIADKGKVLPLASWNECQLCETMTQAANKILHNEYAEWSVHTTGCGNSQLYVQNECIGNGLQMWLYDTHTPCSLEELQKAYTHVINTLKQGWVATTLEENPNILHKRSEEEWYLFIKKAPAHDLLMRIIAHQLGLGKKVNVYDEWNNKEKDRRDAYLWVRKDALAEFQHAFGFTLKLHPSLSMGNRFRQSNYQEQPLKKESDVTMEIN